MLLNRMKDQWHGGKKQTSERSLENVASTLGFG